MPCVAMPWNCQFKLECETKTCGQVDGRLLPAPVLQYGQPKNYYAGTTGSWNMVDVRAPLATRACRTPTPQSACAAAAPPSLVYSPT